MSIMYTHLTERDTYEGKQLAEMISSLHENDKMQVTIYVQALEDRAKLSRFNLASQSADGQMEKDMKEVV